ncbi:MAG: DUF5684 domain-containing protein [Bulleidia sp.]
MYNNIRSEVIGMYMSYWYLYDLFQMFFFGILFSFFAVFFLTVIGTWMIFRKACQHPWAALVPFYGSYVMSEITWGQGWLFLVPYALGVLSMIPIIGKLFSLLSLIFYIATAYKLSLAFGHGIGWAFGLFFLPFVFRLIIGLGQSHYFGVPLDGFSWTDIHGWIQKVQNRDMEYTTPEHHDPDQSEEE